jgi:hypothetical protein
MAKIVQIPLGAAPHNMGRYVAMLDITQEELAKRFGLAFERVRDDLDDLDVASIRTDSGVHALLGFYLNAPKKGIDVYVRDGAGDFHKDLEDVLRAMEITDQNIIWRDPAE